ncbi:MAG: hypothetical protein KBC48_00485 [Candidatus Pacebacteria bacterium]|nr:hypothetical protein [Candidatus Paceibacterota bacterium]
MIKRVTWLLLIWLALSGSALAYVASSTNYQIELDSINFAGGLSTSTNYSLEDTAGEVGSGSLSSATYNIHAGYQQMTGTASTLSITSPSNVTLTPAIPETGGGTATGSTSWTVTTSNSAGYELEIAAAASPALTTGSDSFTDYVPAGASPDFTFTVASASSVFAFSPEGSHIASRYKDNGSTCATGSGDVADACWDGFSTTDRVIATSGSATPSGTATTLNLRAAAGAAKTQPDGAYSATLTVTATAL